MGTFRKVDSTSLSTKLELRSWLLGRMGITEAYVLDTCAGLGKIWEAMHDRVTIRQWTRCDVKPRRPGVIKLEATEAIERFPLQTYNVIDIDPYGEPWEPFLALLPRLRRPTAVFLTYCHLGNGNTSKAALEAAGIPGDWCLDLPRSPEVQEVVADACLSKAWDFVDVTHAAKVTIGQGTIVNYYGLGLAPRT